MRKADHTLSPEELAVKEERRKQLGREATRRYQAKNKEKRKAYWAQYSAKNREKLNAHVAQYRASMTTEEKKALYRKHHLNSKKKRCAYTRAYCAANKEERKEKRKVYRKTPHAIALARHHSHVRRVRLKGCQHTATAADVRDFMAKETHCLYCSRPFSLKLPSTLDHITPIAKGGSHSLDNFEAACLNCNSQKQAQDPHIFARLRGVLFF